jgi:hypothetical protein
LEHVKVLLVNIEPYRKQFSLSSSFSNLIKSNAERLREYTMENLHAEMIFTEATLLKAGLTIMTDESIFSLIKGVLAAKEAHSLYTELLRYLIFLRKESKAGKTSALEENVINDGHFVSGIYLGLGGFNLVLSLLPNIVLRLLELIGLPANQAAGLKMLDQGGSFEHAVRGPLCDMASLFFHSVLGALLEIPSCDVEIAMRLLEKNSKIYPNGAFYLFFEGKVHQTKKLIRTSTECFQKTIQANWLGISSIICVIGNCLGIMFYFVSGMKAKNSWKCSTSKANGQNVIFAISRRRSPSCILTQPTKSKSRRSPS